MQLLSVLHVLLEFTKHVVTQNLTKLCLQLVAANSIALLNINLCTFTTLPFLLKLASHLLVNVTHSYQKHGYLHII